MPNRRTLERLLRTLSLDELTEALVAARGPVSGLRAQRAANLADALLAGRVTFERVLAPLGKTRFEEMCGEAELSDEGLKEELRARLVAWFDESFAHRVASDDEDDEDDEREADESSLDDAPARHKSYREPGYAELFRREVMYVPGSASQPARDYQIEACRTLLAGIRPLRPLVLHVATGGGKTWIANNTLVDWQKQHPGWVLWVTKDWRLLHQAARDLGRRHAGYAKALARLGGDGNLLHPLPQPERFGDGAVVYTTLSTLAQRLQGPFKSARPRPALVVWDECHWGEHAAGGRRLLKWCRQHEVPLLGLTATPRAPDRSEFQVACSVDFVTLVERGILARPIPMLPVKTGVQWAPDRDALLGDFKAASLKELAQNAKRNRLIVRHYEAHKDAYGRTLVFACNIEHADRLATMFKGQGVPVGCVHSGRKEVDSDEDVRRFAKGELAVLVNVAKLTHGVDIPEVNTVFLCRPTMSDILFSQMVGRGSRRHDPSGKTTFNIVEFTDNLEKFGDQLRTTKQFFQGATGGGLAVDVRARVDRGARGPVTDRYTFDPAGRALWIPDVEGVEGELRGLWVREGQTFGIEFELTNDDYESIDEGRWRSVAEALRRRLATALPGRVADRVFYAHGDAGRSYKVWNVERDGSCGWEVVSRVLVGPEGYREVVEACRALASAASDLGLRVNHRTGTHVHLGWRTEDLDVLRRVVDLVKVFEPAAASLVAPSRVASFDGAAYDTTRPNEYCQPIATVFPRTTLSRLRTLEAMLRVAEDGENRYVTVNLASLRAKGTIEVRMHSGTLEASKILLWTSLWQQVLWAAEREQAVDVVHDRDVLRPDGDIHALAARYLPAVQQLRFLQRLDERRREVADLWQQHPALLPWRLYASAWGG